MIVFGIRCFALYFMIFGFFFLFKINIADLFPSRQSIKASVQQAKSGKKNFIRRYCVESIQVLRILRVKNPENTLAAFSFGLALFGVLLGCLFNNALLCLIFAVIGIVTPIFGIRFFWSLKAQKMSDSLDVALSRITASYMRPGMTFEAALRENLNDLPDLVRPIFERILLQMNYVDADIVKALKESKLGIHNHIYHEWINAVIRCQNNQSLKPTLPYIVNKFTDQRIIIGEAMVVIREYRRNFFIMAAATVLSPFLLYLIRREWFNLLLTNTLGKVLLAFLAICLVISLYIGIPALTPNYNFGHDTDEFEE